MALDSSKSDGESSFLAIVLKSASPLYESNLTLEQLIPVHSSLLQAMAVDSSHNSGSDHNLSFQPWCRNAAEAQLCQSVLSNSQEQLGSYILVVQYLFRRASTSGTASASLLWWRLWTFWEKNNERFQVLNEPAYGAKAAASSSSPSSSPSVRFQETEVDTFLQAVVQAVLNSQSEGIGVSSITHWIDQPEEFLSSNQVTEWYWNRTTVLLVRWAKAVDPKDYSEMCQIMALFFERALKAAWENVTDKTWKEPTSWYELPQWAGWKALTQFMLPALVDLLENSENVSKLSALLWKIIWAFWIDIDVPEEDRPVKLLVVTTLLCPIWPYLVQEKNLPLLALNQEERLPLVQHVDVWDLLHQCLQQGLDNESSPAFLTVATLLRRRGLFLIRTLVADHEHLGDWNQYVACFETLEMEEDKHLVQQVWSTVADLMGQAYSRTDSASISTPPVLSMKWMLLLLGHALTATALPFLRKENLFRFFRGQTGIAMPEIHAPVAAAPKPNKKKGRGSDPVSAPLTALPFDFVWNIVVPSFDSLEQSVGLHVHWIINGKTEKYDVSAAFDHFFFAYMGGILRTKGNEMWLGPWLTSNIISQLRAKTTTAVLKQFAAILEEQGKQSLVLGADDIANIATSFRKLFDSGRVISAYRASILLSLSTILANSNINGKVNPNAILSIIKLYPYPQNIVDEASQGDDTNHWMQDDAMFANLSRWMGGIVETDSAWSLDIPSTLASAFVDGLLTGQDEINEWMSSTKRKEEHVASRSIVFLCVLAVSRESSSTASQMLWPAINKGLSLTPSVLLGGSTKSGSRVFRASILLEHGCKVQVLSGNGNGDLVVDRKTNQMMPPPPSIEILLSHAVSFLLHMVKGLLSAPSEETTPQRSSGARASVLSGSFARHLESLRTFSRGYPSSNAVAEAGNEYLRLGLNEVMKQNKLPITSVQSIAMVFGALCCGADMELDVESTCRSILNLELDGLDGHEGPIQPIRSIFEYSRWGSLAKFLPRLLDSSEATIFQEVLEVASSAVEKCPVDALMPLFECALATGSHLVPPRGTRREHLSTATAQHLHRLIQLLARIMADTERGRDGLIMLDESSRLLFQPKLLFDEYSRLKDDVSAMCSIRDSFRKLVASSGPRRPHRIRTMLARVIPGWMGDEKTESGLNAIPYRDDIVDLLMFKEEKLEAAAVSNVILKSTGDDKAQIPQTTHELSLVRAFVLSFVAQLPDPDAASQEVRVDLLNYIILTLLKRVKFGKNLPMQGTTEYCKSLRGWQALCVLSKYAGEDIAEQVCVDVFEAMEEQLHSQTRFFIEIFALQCARKHPIVFGKALVNNLIRHDLHLQMVSSLMIISGHLVVGKYKDDFLPFTSLDTESPVSLNKILTGAIPWLSSTQGFSRAIAQLLVHALIPMIIDVKRKGNNGDAWYLRSIYEFLDKNTEMNRLRKKQTKFFDNLDADLYLTPEGCLSTVVDEVGEANPKHMIEIIKRTLAETYSEAHGDDAPNWKKIQTMMEETDEDEMDASLDDSLVNFQRKIIPLDALNIALDQHREKRFKNLAGRRKQALIVCASLVDKLPNLAGLARTCEIFAADRMVLPDRKVVKMDNFANISVSASEWIEIEECNEKDLLRWLRARKLEGWYVVGIEQTSSSLSMVNFQFPNRPTILLLGKEKEGIPVQYLQAVDQCVEIPQLGIIRSLNVHVSGALAIWEFTRQRMGCD